MKGKFDLAKWAEGVRRKHGDDSEAFRDILRQFVDAVSVENPETGCRTIPGAPRTEGGKPYAAWFPMANSAGGIYRAVAFAHHGPKPHGQEHHTRHLCGGDDCISPAHLRYGSRAENSSDRVAHGTTPRLVSAETVANMRREYRAGARASDLCRKYGVKDNTITSYLTGRSGDHTVFADCAEPPCDLRGARDRRHLSDAQATDVILRAQAGERHVQIARDVGVSANVIGAIARGERYRHIPRTDLSIRDPAE